MKRPSVKTVLISLGVFLLFVILLFPYQNLRGYIFGLIKKNSGGVVVDSQDLSLSLFGWPGASLTNVEVFIPGFLLNLPPGNDITLAAKKVVARVGIGGLFPPRPSLSVNLEGLKKGGNLYLKMIPGKTSHYVYFYAEKVNLEGFPSIDSPTTAHGLLSGEGTITADLANPSASKGDIKLHLEKFRTPPFVIDRYPYSAVNMGNINAKIQIVKGDVTINQFDIGDPTADFQGKIGGDVRMGNTFPESKVNVNVNLSASAAFQNNGDGAAFRSLLNSYDASNHDKAWCFNIDKPVSATMEATLADFLGGKLHTPCSR